MAMASSWRLSNTDSTAQEHQGSDLAYRIQEHNGNEDQTQDHHQRSMRLVHWAE